MQPEMNDRFELLQRNAARLSELARDVTAAFPDRADGADATGGVRMVLGADGLPTEIRIRDGWQQRIEPDRLGAAVVEANADAIQRAMRVWTDQLDDNRWSMRRADVDEASDQQGGPGTADPPVIPTGQRREATELAEHALGALHIGKEQSAGPTRYAVEGTDDTQHVSIQLGPAGLTGCTIDAQWATGRDGAAISNALSGALRRAIGRRPAPAVPGNDMTSLVGDALTTLRSLTLPTGSGGDR